jgi:hypothetical protein
MRTILVLLVFGILPACSAYAPLSEPLAEPCSSTSFVELGAPGVSCGGFAFVAHTLPTRYAILTTWECANRLSADKVVDLSSQQVIRRDKSAQYVEIDYEISEWAVVTPREVPAAAGDYLQADDLIHQLVANGGCEPRL